MAQNLLPTIPNPPTIRTIEDVDAYIKLLYSTLSSWKTVLSNTGFLGTVGSNSGHLIFSTKDPTSTDGDDGDVWVSY
jgi:hypothetical protein